MPVAAGADTLREEILSTDREGAAVVCDDVGGDTLAVVGADACPLDAAGVDGAATGFDSTDLTGCGASG